MLPTAYQIVYSRSLSSSVSITASISRGSLHRGNRDRYRNNANSRLLLAMRPFVESLDRWTRQMHQLRRICDIYGVEYLQLPCHTRALLKSIQGLNYHHRCCNPLSTNTQPVESPGPQSRQSRFDRDICPWRLVYHSVLSFGLIGH